MWLSCSPEAVVKKKNKKKKKRKDGSGDVEGQSDAGEASAPQTIDVSIASRFEVQFGELRQLVGGQPR